MSEPQYEGFYTFDELLERGWHRRTIWNLFGNPSKVIYAGGKRVELYSKVTAQQMEAASSFASIQQDHAKESKALFKERVRDAEQSRFAVPRLPMKQLKSVALQFHNRRKLQDSAKPPLLPPPGFWETIMVDYLVMREREYIPTREGKMIEKIEIRQHLRVVADAYPELADECSRRLTRLGSEES